MIQQTNKIEFKKVSELCDLKKGKKVSSTQTKTKSSVPYLLIDTLRGMEPEFFTEDKNYTEAIPEDILIVADGANSGLVGTGVKGAVGSTILRIRINVNDLNKDFNVELHEAITEIPVTEESKKGKVVDEITKGYLLNDKIIRFAKVVVGK